MCYHPHTLNWERQCENQAQHTGPCHKTCFANNDSVFLDVHLKNFTTRVMRAADESGSGYFPGAISFSKDDPFLVALRELTRNRNLCRNRVERQTMSLAICKARQEVRQKRDQLAAIHYEGNQQGL